MALNLRPARVKIKNCANAYFRVIIETFAQSRHQDKMAKIRRRFMRRSLLTRNLEKSWNICVSSKGFMVV
jgi:hypothetical protein